MLVCRKSIVISRSSFPSGACVPPFHVDRAPTLRGLGRADGGLGAQQVLEEVLVALARGAEQVGPPDRQDAWVVVRGVRVLAREVELPGPQLLDDVLPHRHAGGRGVLAQVKRVAVERGVRRHPAHPGALRDHVGCRPAGEPALAGGGRQRVGAELVISVLVAVEIPVRRLDHVARRPAPVERVGDLGVAGDRPDLLLPDVVRPATAVDALAAGQVGQGEKRAVDRVGVEPVVGAGAHHDHRAAARLLGVGGELTADPGRRRGGHPGDRLLPGGGVRRVGVVVPARPLTRQALPVDGAPRRTARGGGRKRSSPGDRPRVASARRAARSSAAPSGVSKRGIRTTTGSVDVSSSDSSGSTAPRSRFHRPTPASPYR